MTDTTNEIKALRHTATPWVAMEPLGKSFSDHGYRKVCDVSRNGKTMVVYAEAQRMLVDGKGFVFGEDDAEFIVRACNDHDQLTELVASQEARIAALEAQLSASVQGEPMAYQMLCRPTIFYPASHKPTDVNNFRPLYAAQPSIAADQARDAAMDSALCDAMVEQLGDLYSCGRVWSAWSVGTMSEDDFSIASEDDDIVSNFVDAARAAIARVLKSAPIAQQDGIAIVRAALEAAAKYHDDAAKFEMLRKGRNNYAVIVAHQADAITIRALDPAAILEASKSAPAVEPVEGKVETPKMRAAFPMPYFKPVKKSQQKKQQEPNNG